MKTYTLILITVFLFTGNILGQTFTQVTTGAIVNDKDHSLASNWIDFNNDSYLDLFVANWTAEDKNLLYLNNSDGTFTKITTGIIVNDAGNSHASSWGDYDNDGNIDAFVANWYDNNFLYHNNGDGTFTKVTNGSIVNDGGLSNGTSWGDYNNDGFIDIFVSNRHWETPDTDNFLYLNNGDGTFTKITEGDIVNDGGYSFGCSWADYDNDGDFDLFVANGGFIEEGNNFLYQNNGDGSFTKITTGEIVNDGGNSSGGSWGDYDNDGDLDLYVTNDGDQNNFLYRNNGNATFTRITEGSIVNDGGGSWGSSWGDYDNDGDLDLFVANGGEENDFLYFNNGDGTFNRIIDGVVVNDGSPTGGGSWGDYDNDGDLDLFVTSDDPDYSNILYLNNGNDDNWINIKCVGTVSNASAIGAKVRVKANIDGTHSWQLREISAQTGYGGQNSLNVEFGLGDAIIIDSLTIEWPSGNIENFIDIAVNQFITVTEGEIQNIVVSDDSLNYGVIYVGFPSMQELFISNAGSGVLTVSDISSDNDDFTVDTTSFTLNPFQRQAVEVTFAPAIEGLSTGTLTISSSDPDNPTVTVVLQGQGLEPPDIAVSEESFSDTLLTGASSVQYLTIENTGTTDLVWEISLGGLGLGTVTFTKEDYADCTLPENQDRITENVWITRANTQGIFNAATESEYSHSRSPEDTEWAYGLTEELEPLDYQVWYYAVDGYPPGMVGDPISMHLITDDIYLDVMFHSWTRGGDGGGFSYTRSDPRPKWLSVSLDSGAVAPGADQQIAVNIDAFGLDAGGHDAAIVLASNDPDEGALIIPVHLDVTSATDIYTSIDTLDFGQVFVDYVDSLELVVENKGTEDLLITSVVAEPAEYTIVPLFAGVDPDETDLFLVKFAPTSVADYPGTLTFTTNDPDEGTFIIPLRGQGVEPPVAAVAIDSLIATLAAPDDSIQQVMTISNTGASDLVYELWAVHPEEPGAGSPPLAKAIDPGVADDQSGRSLRDLLGQVLDRPQQQEPSSILERKVVSTPINETDNPIWRLLYTDPDESSLDLDIKNVYGATTLDEILFKVDVYEPLVNVEYFTLLIGIDADQSTETGLGSEETGWLAGCDYVISLDGYRYGEYEYFAGYLWRFIVTPYDWDIEEVDTLTTMIFDTEADEIILGINAQHFEGSPAINIGLEVYLEDGEDIIPDERAGYIVFALSPPWIMLSPAAGVIPAGSEADIIVTFDASGIYDGVYYADIQVNSNDPVTPQLVVHTRFSVSGKPPRPPALWTRSYGGSGDDRGVEIQQTTDGGYIIAGWTDSYGAGSIDFWLLRTDALGDTLWTKTYGGSLDESVRSVSQTADGGYILTGSTASYGAGDSDAWLVKTDGSGDTLWTRTYGGNLYETAQSVSQTTDGGYILAGSTESYGAGDWDAWLIKTNSLGDTLWTRTFGGEARDASNYGLQTADGGYILAGSTDSYGAGGRDAWLIKTDTLGNALWTQTYGGTGNDVGSNAKQASDGGYILCGHTTSFGAGLNDIWLVKTDSSGNALWTRTYGGSGQERFPNFDTTSDGGYIIAGRTQSFGAGDYDAWLIRTDSEGDTIWTRTCGGESLDISNYAQQTANGGYIAIGYTQSFGVGGNDLWLMATDSLGSAVPLEIVKSESGVLPLAIALYQNYPNPFNPVTTIGFDLPYATDISLVVYDLLGREVVRLVDQRLEAGYQQVIWNGRDRVGREVPTGMYIARLLVPPTAGVTPEYSKSIRMVLLK